VRLRKIGAPLRILTDDDELEVVVEVEVDVLCR